MAGSIEEPGSSDDPVTTFKQRLQRFRQECGNPSYRDLDRLFGRLERPQSFRTIQQKVTGATIPDWPFVEVFVQACARHVGIDTPDLQRWRDAHTRMLADATAQAGTPAGDPYRRLDAFGENDTIWFHGRRDAVEQIVAALRHLRPALLVLGPSGAGKSSLIHAGILPALAEGALPGSDQWVRVSARPRQNLLAELEDAGLPEAGTSLSEAIDRRLADQPAECRLVLVIDQFEELLTPIPDPDLERVRQDTIAQLTMVAGQPRVIVILIMRDDFYPHLTAQARKLRTTLTLVDLPATLTVAQLDDIIRSPAQTAGLTWDARLPEQIITDVLDSYDTDTWQPATKTQENLDAQNRQR